MLTRKLYRYAVGTIGYTLVAGPTYTVCMATVRRRARSGVHRHPRTHTDPVAVCVSAALFSPAHVFVTADGPLLSYSPKL